MRISLTSLQNEQTYRCLQQGAAECVFIAYSAVRSDLYPSTCSHTRSQR